MNLGSIENIYVVLSASFFYLAGGASAEQTIIFGSLACVCFLPSYRILTIGARHVRLRFLAAKAIAGVVFIVFIRNFLNEQILNDMVVLFVFSYVAGKGLRFFIVGLINYKRV